MNKGMQRLADAGILEYWQNSISVSVENSQAKMKKAFALVADPRDWRAKIDTILTSKKLEKAGLTVEDVKQAVRHFTGTEAKVVVGYYSHNYTVTAIGYRNGPCGP
jgi:hypothetical protein